MPPKKASLVTAQQIVEIPSRNTWFNLKTLPFEENPDMWYNLHTGRFVKHQPKDLTISHSLRGIRVLGSIEQIMQFWRINVKQLGVIYPQCTLFQQVTFQPFLDIGFLTEDVARRSRACHMGKAGTIIPATRATDVEQLTSEEVGQLCPFSFAGLFVKCRIVDVVDGDTIHVVIFVPIHELGAARSIGPQGSPRVGMLPQQTTLTDRDTGFFALATIRMYGYDAQEKDSTEGKLAKKLLIDKFTSLNNIIWCQFVEITIAQEKYDRILGVLFEDKDRKCPLNDFLLKKEKELNVRLVNPYLGGTKQSFS